MEGGTDAEPTSVDEPGVSVCGTARMFDLVKDVLESVIGEVIEKCKYPNKSKSGKVELSEEQRVRLEQIFSEGRYLRGKTKDELSAELGVGSKQLVNWFEKRRRAEAKAEALRTEKARRVATTWPHYKLNCATLVEEVSEVKEDMKTVVRAHSGEGLLKELEENIDEVERRALDMVVTHPMPLLNAMLPQQEVMNS